MEAYSDYVARKEALAQALLVTTVEDAPDRTLEIAEKFFKFLKGEYRG